MKDIERPWPQGEIAIPAARWYADMPVPALEALVQGGFKAALRQFSDTSPEILQPALSDNVLAIHLGGPKRVRRWQAGRFSMWDVEPHSLTLMPAFQHNRWLTEGPIGFAHLTLSLGLLGQFAREEFDRQPSDLLLLDKVGQTDALATQLFLALLDDLRDPGPGRLFRESLLTTLIIAVLKSHSTLSAERRTPSCAGLRKPALRGGLAGWQLRRVIDYMAGHLSDDVGIADLVVLTGLSRAQFFRAFRQSTGQSPHRYLNALRIEHAKQLLAGAALSPKSVAAAVGFTKPRQFAAVFRRQTGLSPRLYRRSC